MDAYLAGKEGDDDLDPRRNVYAHLMGYNIDAAGFKGLLNFGADSPNGNQGDGNAGTEVSQNFTAQGLAQGDFNLLSLQGFQGALNTHGGESLDFGNFHIVYFSHYYLALIVLLYKDEMFIAAFLGNFLFNGVVDGFSGQLPGSGFSHGNNSGPEVAFNK